MFWRKPPPEKLWIQKPAWITVMITLVLIFVLGPVGAIYNGMAEDQKQNTSAIVQNQLAIKELLTRQQMILAPKAIKLAPIKSTQIQAKKPVPPDYFQAYMKLPKDSQVGYKLYLEQLGYDVRGLP